MSVIREKVIYYLQSKGQVEIKTFGGNTAERLGVPESI
jgi:hypothetical protein